MAEGILRHKAQENSCSIELDSCGTSAWHIGESPDGRAQQNLHSHGIDISDLRARQFAISDFEDFDIIYAMDNSNYQDIVSLATNQGQKERVRMILNEIQDGENLDVPDPYFGGDNGFENVYNMLDLACDKIIEKVQ